MEWCIFTLLVILISDPLSILIMSELDKVSSMNCSVGYLLFLHVRGPLLLLQLPVEGLPLQPLLHERGVLFLFLPILDVSLG